LCGITGILNLEDKSLLKSMCNILKHRGPDSDGYYQDNEIGLAMRRLSIIDLEGGNQPIHNEEEDIWVVFNGEIYNYKDLQKKLSLKGHRFSTNSDTEVIVHAYEEFGLDFVKFLRGMFAIALWDGRNKKLILARDRLGVKPLYYLVKNNQIFFASELKAFTEFDQFKLTLNHEAISDYLTFLCIPAPSTVFNEVNKLMPGELLVANKDGTYFTKKYWHIKFEDQKLSLHEHAKKLRSLLEESVNLRMVSDVPVGILLSSGLDSTTIALFAKKLSSTNLNSYTVGFQDSAETSYDEVKDAREFAEFIGTNHHEIIIDGQDAMKLLDLVSWHMDEPFADPTSILNYYICNFASKTSKVVISGVGGDEMFGGYPKYVALKKYEQYRKFPYCMLKLGSPIFAKLPDNMGETVIRGKKFFNSWKNNQLDSYVELSSFFDEQEKQKFFKFPHPHSRRIIDKLNNEAMEQGATNFYQRLFYMECMNYLPNNILEYTDKTSMAVSLEVREPLIDHKIVEYCASIPFDMKIKNWSGKHLLKIAMKDLLPKKTLKLKKRGFMPPLINWLDKSINDLESKYLSKKDITEQGIFDYLYIKKLIDNYKKGTKRDYLKLWTIITFESWFHKFIK